MELDTLEFEMPEVLTRSVKASSAASRLAFAASPLNSVAPNAKKTSGTLGKKKNERGERGDQTQREPVCRLRRSPNQHGCLVRLLSWQTWRTTTLTELNGESLSKTVNFSRALTLFFHVDDYTVGYSENQ